MPYYWVRNLDLRNFDMAVILKNGMLSDRHMHAVNKLMKVQFPHLQGLHSTLLVQTSGFPELPYQEATYQKVSISSV